jgi:hypothetical protein
MSGTHQSAMFIYSCQLHATSLAHLKTMLSINEQRRHEGKAPAYSEGDLQRQLDLIDGHIINPRDFE